MVQTRSMLERLEAAETMVDMYRRTATSTQESTSSESLPTPPVILTYTASRDHDDDSDLEIDEASLTLWSMLRNAFVALTCPRRRTSK